MVMVSLTEGVYWDSGLFVPVLIWQVLQVHRGAAADVSFRVQLQGGESVFRPDRVRSRIPRRALQDGVPLEPVEGQLLSWVEIRHPAGEGGLRPQTQVVLASDQRG